MKKFVKQIKNERGLTLVELLAVVVILGIVGTIAVVSIGNIIDNSRKDAVISNAMQAVSAAKLAEASTNSSLPDEWLITAGGSDNDNLDTMEELIDPWNEDGESSYSITVTPGEYKVTSDGTGECDFTATENDLRTKDRDELCGETEDEEG